MASDQKITLMGKPYNPDQGKIPASQQAARDLRASKRDQQKPRSAGDIIKGALHRGVENFLDNMHRPVGESQRDYTPPSKKKRGSHRESHGGTGLDVSPGPFLNTDLMRDLGGDEIDFSMHPDPMYHGIGGHRSRKSRHGPEGEGAKSVTVTKTTYHY